MSKTIEISKNLSLTWFWGGDKKKRCVQITKKDTDLTEAYGHPCYNYVNLTMTEMKKLVRTFINYEILINKKEKIKKKK